MSDLSIRSWRHANTELLQSEGSEELSAKAARRPLETARTRLLVAGAIFTICFAILGGRLIQLSLLGGAQDEIRAATSQNHILTLERADIVDRNGTLLATNLPSHSLYVEPKKILDIADASKKVASILTYIDYNEIYKKISSDKNFAWIKRDLTPKEHFNINRLGLPGIGFQREERRVYPQGSLFVHTVGFSGTDNLGLAGLEAANDQRLKALAQNSGEKLVTTLDSRVQHIVHSNLQAAMERFSAKGAASIVLDIDTGEVISLVSLPDFNPHQLRQSSANQRFNRATLGVYELGSALKPFTTAMALEYGVAELNDRYDASKPLKVARHTIRDHHPQNRWLDLTEILVHSSNIGAAQMALEIGGERQKAFLKNLGMLSRLPLELKENGAPLSPTHWREINTMTIAYGHGISMTPLHLISGFSTLLNGGFKTTPTLLQKNSEQRGPRVVARETSHAMRDLMRKVVETGTGKQADAEGYLVGGKTGTAEKAIRGGYKKDAVISTFIGAFPMDAPRYAVLVMLDEPHGIKATHGFAGAGWTAAPVLGRIVSNIAPILRVMPRLPANSERKKSQELLVRVNGEGTQLEPL